MRKILVISSLLVMFMFLVSCAPQQPLTDEELQAELAKLTPEERAELLKDLESKEDGALAGQAVAKKYSTFSPKMQKILKASPEKVKLTLNTFASIICGNKYCDAKENPIICKSDCVIPVGNEEYCWEHNSNVFSPWLDIYPYSNPQINSTDIFIAKFLSTSSTPRVTAHRIPYPADYCVDGTTLAEFYCDPNDDYGFSTIYIDCGAKFGQVCQRDACRPLVIDDIE